MNPLLARAIVICRALWGELGWRILWGKGVIA
jgi:hypothetical protein